MQWESQGLQWRASGVSVEVSGDLEGGLREMQWGGLKGMHWGPQEASRDCSGSLKETQ